MEQHNHHISQHQGYNNYNSNNHTSSSLKEVPQQQNHSYEYINKECCCFNMRKVMRAITQYYDRCLESSDIRSTQFTLLVALDCTTAKTLTEIAETLVMDRTTLTRNLKPLTKMGLIITVNTTDRRSKAYALTEKGKNLLVTCVPLWRSAQENVIKSIGIDNYKDLFSKTQDLLHKLSLFK